MKCKSLSGNPTASTITLWHHIRGSFWHYNTMAWHHRTLLVPLDRGMASEDPPSTITPWNASLIWCNTWAQYSEWLDLVWRYRTLVIGESHRRVDLRPRWVFFLCFMGIYWRLWQLLFLLDVITVAIAKEDLYCTVVGSSTLKARWVYNALLWAFQTRRTA